MSALEALERGDFDKLPGDFYTRSYLKAYAREVSLPPEDLLRAYDDEVAPQPQPERAVVLHEPVDPLPQPLSPKHPQPARVLEWPRRYNAPVGVGLAIVLLVLLVSFRPGQSGSATAAGAVAGAAAAEAAPAAVGTTGRLATPEKLLIEIRPTAPIWVAATADGNSAIYRLLKPGEVVTAEAQKELSFRIGNAGAFVYSINGVPGKPLGGVDEVREFDITLENVQSYRR